MSLSFGIEPVLTALFPQLETASLAGRTSPFFEREGRKSFNPKNIACVQSYSAPSIF